LTVEQDQFPVWMNRLQIIQNKKSPERGFFAPYEVRWKGLEPPRLAAHGPQPSNPYDKEETVGLSHSYNLTENHKWSFLDN